jgi:hypothetical protein
MRYSLLAVGFATAFLSSPIHAAEKTVVLDIQNANCVLRRPIVH